MTSKVTSIPQMSSQGPTSVKRKRGEVSLKNTPSGSGPKCSLVNDFDDVPPPDKAWTPNKLGQYAAEQNEQLKLVNRRLAIHVYRLGQALILAKAKTKHGKWGGFLRKYRISHATWIRAKQLAERATEADLRKVGLTESYVKFGILVQRDVSDTHHQSVKKAASKQKAVAKKSVSSTGAAESASDTDAEAYLQAGIVVPKQFPSDEDTLTKPIKVPTIITPSKAKLTLENDGVLKVLQGLDTNSFDGGLSDPPYGLRFMNKTWDEIPSVEVWSGTPSGLQAGGDVSRFWASSYLSSFDGQHRRCGLGHQGHDCLAVRHGDAQKP